MQIEWKLISWNYGFRKWKSQLISVVILLTGHKSASDRLLVDKMGIQLDRF